MKKIKVVIPKGRLNKKVLDLLNDVGLGIEANGRCYIPRVEHPQIDIKIMKPQNIPQLVELGSHDIGFTGLDWVQETGVTVAILMDLGFDPVSIVAAVPDTLSREELFKKKIVAASEYESIAKKYLDRQGFDYYFIRTYGATEVFPPGDADMIIDNMSSGRTLAENNLKIIDRLNVSTTRMIANPEAMKDPTKSKLIDELLMLIRSVLDARNRVMLEMNIPAARFEFIAAELPSMRAPTVSPLYNDEGFAVKVAVKKSEAVRLIPKLKALGATDILEYDIRKVAI